MKDNLKNCPFCDGEGKLETMLYGGTAVSCQNTDCGFYGYNVETSMWNTRPNDAKWISVEDGIEPNHLQGVLTVENDDEDTLCLEVYIGKSKNGKLMFSESYPREPVTHYMPLPAPPKQSSEGEEG